MDLEGKYIPETNYIYDFSEIFKGIVVDKTFDRTLIKDIILNQHNIILSFDLFFNYNREKIQALFTNDTFLDCLNDVAGVLTLTRDELFCLNTITYDYMNSGNDKNITELLLSIVYQTNQYIINSLGAWFDIQSSRLLSIICLSNFNKRLVVERLNKFLENIAILPVEAIIGIYDYLTGNNIIDEFSLFIGTMTDNVNYGNTIEKPMYNIISEAILRFLFKIHALDGGTPGSISYRLLYNYGFYIKSNNITKDKVRFCLKSKMFNDPTLLQVIEYIENENSEIVTIY